MRLSPICVAIAAVSAAVLAPTSASAQTMVRIDQLGASSFKLRVVLTSTKRINGKRKKITVSLGEVPAGEVAVPVWPVNKKLVKGTYNARLTATSNTGATLTRPPGSRGTTTLKVVKGKATIASIPFIGGRMVALAQ